MFIIYQVKWLRSESAIYTYSTYSVYVWKVYHLEDSVRTQIEEGEEEEEEMERRIHVRMVSSETNR